MNKVSRLTLVLTAINLTVLMLTWTQLRTAAAQNTPDVLRGRALELVDARGRVRASIEVLPRDPSVRMPDGTTGYPETVLLRLIDSNGSPHVKIAATEDGSAVVFGGQSDPTLIQLLARGATASITTVNKDGRQRVIEP
jgi:hypothetical protein